MFNHYFRNMNPYQGDSFNPNLNFLHSEEETELAIDITTEEETVDTRKSRPNMPNPNQANSDRPSAPNVNNNNNNQRPVPPDHKKKPDQSQKVKLPTPNLTPSSTVLKVFKNCEDGIVYVWLKNGDSFWMVPKDSNLKMISGYRWDEVDGWYDVEIKMSDIFSVTCIS